MIATLSGVVTEKYGDIVVMEVGGIGYGLFVSFEDADHLIIGDKTKLYVYEHIRENAHDLFGFKFLEARIMFELLLTVNGVGPKMAMAVMGLGSLANIRGSIANGDTRFLQSASGVGKRVAERMVVDLKDKMGVLASAEATGFLSAPSPGSDEAVQALMALGFNAQDAGQALNNIDKTLPLEDRIRLALKER